MHGASAVLHKIGGFQIRDVQFDGKGVLVVGFRDGKAAAPGRIVKAAHVPADGNGFLDVQLHEPLNEENEDSDGASSHSEGQDSDEEEKYVLCTMPAVNKDRRDAGMDYVKTVYEETMSQLDTVNAAYTAKISKLLINAKPEELDEAKDELKKLHDNHVDICKNYRDEKETQLEEAYQKYLQAESEKESAEQEKQAARGQDAGKQMSMDAWATEEE